MTNFVIYKGNLVLLG